MGTVQERVESVVREFVARVKPEAGQVTHDVSLYADGAGLDSLEAAELSAVLEDEFGTDPFQSDTMPETLGDIVAFYAAADA